MKKLFLIMALGITGVTCSAQIEKVVLKPANRSDISNTIILDSIKRVLPAPVSQILSVVNGRAWNVDITPVSGESEVTRYYVYLKGKDGRQTLVFNKDGNLVHAKQVIKNVDVPEPIEKALKTRYRGWAVLGNEERHIADNRKTSADYKVILKKGMIKKAVLFDPDGDIKIALPAV